MTASVRGLPHARSALVGLAGLVLTLFALQREAPLFVNFGPGDEPFARGFRSGWERENNSASIHSTFHWTKDGSRIELPVRILSGSPEARIRVARFLDSPVEIFVWAHRRVERQWVQPPHDWSVTTWPLHELRGPFRLLMRVQPEEGETLGVAIDWMEVNGVRHLWPRANLAIQLGVLFVGVPLLAAWLCGPRSAVALASVAAVLGPTAVLCDRFGGLVALGQSAGPMVVVVLAVAGTCRVIRHLGASATATRPMALGACFVACLALFQPFFHHPDVDTHARFVEAIVRDPRIAWDPTPYQQRYGAWTRTIGSKTIGFPYSPGFHLVALPLAPLTGAVVAVKTVAIAAVGTSILAVSALAALLGLAATGQVVAAVLFTVMPVVSSRLTLALYPALLAQALELVLGVYLIRWLAQDRPSFALLAAALFAAQIVYTGSIVNVGSVALVLGAILGLGGGRNKVARLWGAEALAVLAVLALLYARFVPTLVRDVLPAATAVSLEGSPGGRLFIFYGVVYPALTVLGFFSLQRAQPWAHVIVVAMLVAGVSLLLLRYVVPGALRDVKDVELMAGPVAVLSAAAVCRLWTQGTIARGVALVAVVLLLLRGAALAVTSYTDRFVAVGR